MVVTWKGKQIEELSKDELIEALNWAAEEIQRLMKEKEHERNFIMAFVRKEKSSENQIDELLKTQAEGENLLPLISFYFGDEGEKYAAAQQSVQTTFAPQTARKGAK